MELFQFDWQLIWFHSYHVLAAFVLALPLGWDREKIKVFAAENDNGEK